MPSHKGSSHDEPSAGSDSPLASTAAAAEPSASAAGPPAAVEPAASTLADPFCSFMVELATDPAKLGAFIKNPDAAMKAAGIDEVDQVILKSGHPPTIHSRLSGQRFSFTPPEPSMPVTVLVVDMTRPSGAHPSAATNQPTVRLSVGSVGLPSYGSSTMFPNAPIQIFPQVHPQLVIHPQIFPQVHPQIFPQVHPQLVIHPQLVNPQSGG